MKRITLILLACILSTGCSVIPSTDVSEFTSLMTLPSNGTVITNTATDTATTEQTSQTQPSISDIEFPFEADWIAYTSRDGLQENIICNCYYTDFEDHRVIYNADSKHLINGVPPKCIGVESTGASTEIYGEYVIPYEGYVLSEVRLYESGTREGYLNALEFAVPEEYQTISEMNGVAISLDENSQLVDYITWGQGIVNNQYVNTPIFNSLTQDAVSLKDSETIICSTYLSLSSIAAEKEELDVFRDLIQKDIRTNDSIKLDYTVSEGYEDCFYKHPLITNITNTPVTVRYVTKAVNSSWENGAFDLCVVWNEYLLPGQSEVIERVCLPGSQPLTLYTIVEEAPLEEHIDSIEIPLISGLNNDIFTISGEYSLDLTLTIPAGTSVYHSYPWCESVGRLPFSKPEGKTTINGIAIVDNKLQSDLTLTPGDSISWSGEYSGTELLYGSMVQQYNGFKAPCMLEFSNYEESFTIS